MIGAPTAGVGGPMESIAMHKIRTECNLGESLVDQAAIARFEIPNGTRKWMLGSEMIIRDESIGIGVESDLADEVPVRLGRSPVEPAAMHVNNRGPASGLCRLGPPARYPSD